MNKMYLTADGYIRDQWKLAASVRESGWRPDCIVGLWRGGAPVAVSVHEFLRYAGWDARHFPLKCSSYTGIGRNEGDVVFSFADETFSIFSPGERVLFVDDVFDTGKTAEAILKKAAATSIEARIACVYYKSVKNVSSAAPDYFVRDIGGEWIVFPHETEGLTRDELEEKDAFLSSLLEPFS